MLLLETKRNHLYVIIYLRKGEDRVEALTKKYSTDRPKIFY